MEKHIIDHTILVIAYKNAILLVWLGHCLI